MMQAPHIDTPLPTSSSFCFSLFCDPETKTGGSLRLLIRKGLPSMLGMTLGLTANQLLLNLLENEPQFLNIAVSDLAAELTTLVVFILSDSLLEKCWPTDWVVAYRSSRPEEAEYLLPKQVAQYGTL